MLAGVGGIPLGRTRRNPKRTDASSHCEGNNRKDPSVAAAELLRDLHGQLNQHHRGLLTIARTFLPDIIADAIGKKQLEESRLIVKRCDGAVVFSDASGFTALTERLALRSNGAELLSKCLNKFFTPLIDMLTSYRGDVIKFSGDALTILFAATNDYEDFIHACGSPSCAHAPLELACLRASACCIEIHKRLHNFDTGEGGVRLTLHIGVGAGRVTLLQVGGDQNRYEYVIAGQPLEQIAVAEPLAGSGETVLSPQCWVHVAETVIEGPELQGNSDYHRLKALDITRHSYPTVKQAARQSGRLMRAMMDEAIEDEELERRLAAYTRFIPRSVLKQFRTGSLRGINEMRTVSIFFVKVGGVDVSTDQGALKARTLMQGMQALCYSEEGSLNKFLVDDKGLTFLFVFGLPPLVHIDDPKRACRASLEMTRLLEEQMELTGRIGVTTGRVYCGLVGSDTRQEYTVMGDTVNLSARLTANAQANSVLVDESTFKRCQGEIVFSKLPAIRVKGKENKIPVFRPLRAATQEPEQPSPQPSSNRSFAQQSQPQTPSPPSSGLLQSGLLRPSLTPATCAPPWPPRSRHYGGKSLLSEMGSWRCLEAVQAAVTQQLQHGGGLLVIAGQSGYAKQELAENVLRRCTDQENMLPLFATMQMKDMERWAAPRELLGHLLRQLHAPDAASESAANSQEAGKAAAVVTDEELQQLLSRERLTPAEAAAVAVLEGRQGSSNNLIRINSPAVAVWAPGKNAAKRPWAISDCVRQEEQNETRERVICELARRLVERLLGQRKIVLILRCWRGTALSPGDPSIFWLLARRIGEFASKQAPGRILVIVLCRSLPDSEELQGEQTPDPASPRRDPGSPRRVPAAPGLGVHDRVVNVEPLTDREAHVLAGLMLGVGTPHAPSASVPEPLRHFLNNIALNNSRNVQEALAELQETEKMKASEGRVLLLTELSQVDIAEWVHTSMVGTIISHFEMMGAEAQRVIKMATVLDGPFSALDVAANNRAHLSSFDLLALHDSVQLLMACEWLVGQGFLKRFDYGTKEPKDRQSSRLPRWEIANLLIRKVVGAALLHSQRILMKRRILLARALNIHLPARMRAKAEMRETLFGQPSRTEKCRQQKRGKAPQPSWCTGESSDFSGLPSSCIVLPVDHHGFDSITQSVNLCVTESNPVHDYQRHTFEQESVVPSPTPLSVASRPVMGTAPESHLTLRVCGDQTVPDVDRLADWLHLMCAAPHKPRAMELIKRCAPVATRDAAGLSPLHFASGHGDLELVQALLNATADATVAAPGVGTPLDIAAANGHVEVVRSLARADSKYISLVRSKGPNWKVGGLEASTMPLPVLGHDLPVRSRLEEANYRRSQTLTFVQDSIILAAEEVKEGSASASLEDAHFGGGRMANSVRSSNSAAPTSTLGALSTSFWMKALGVVCTLVAIFGPDVCIIAGGSQDVLDSLLVAVLIFFLGQILLLTVLRKSGYVCTAFFLLDVVGTAAIALDISWLLGSSYRDPMTADTPLDGRSGSFNLVLARLARGAALGNRAGRYSGITRVINLLCCCCLRPSEGGDFGSVEVFRQQLMRSIAAHVAGFTVLLVVVQPLLNFMTLPDSDLSMLAWMTILTSYYGNSTGAAVSGPRWRRELGEFESFYNTLSYYGPYQLCRGRSSGPGFSCAANGSLLDGDNASSVGTIYAEPSMTAARLSVHSDYLEARFDFTTAREREAWMNVTLVFFVLAVMALTTLFITRAISDLVLRPLQRMLTSVKKIAMPILGDVSALGLDTSDEEEEGEVIDDEIYTLERIVRKLGKIAGIATELSAASQFGTSIENLQDEDRGVMQMMFQPNRKKVSRSKAEGAAGSSSAGDPKPTVAAQNDRLPQIDELLRSMHLQFEDVCSWDFNVVQLEGKHHAGTAHWLLLQNTTAHGEIQLPTEVALKFLQTVTQHYISENPYHNFMHAIDVMHTVWMMLRICRTDEFLNSMEQFSLLVSAISHDVGHLGVSNQFLVQTGHDLALRYNDRSPLENMHCAKAFGIASNTPGANVFESLSRSDFFECRRVCIEAILHTDMVHHFDMLKETQMLYQMNVEALETDPAGLFHEKGTRQKVINLFLHAADVSNPCKPWAICHEWAHRVLEEFFSQGDKEKQLGIPVQMLNDRTKVNRPFSQIGFIEFMIVPLVAAKVKLFPMMHEFAEFLQSNMQEWRNLWMDEDNPSDEEREKVIGRVQRACDVLSQAKDGGKHFWSSPESLGDERYRRSSSTRGHYESSD